MVTVLEARALGSYFWNLLCNVRQTPLCFHSMSLSSSPSVSSPLLCSRSHALNLLFSLWACEPCRRPSIYLFPLVSLCFSGIYRFLANKPLDPLTVVLISFSCYLVHLSCLKRFKMSFICSSTSPQPLVLHNSILCTEAKSNTPCTISAQTIMDQPPFLGLALYCFSQIIRITCRLISMRRRCLLRVIAIHRHIIIGCIGFWFRPFCLGSLWLL